MSKSQTYPSMFLKLGQPVFYPNKEKPWEGRKRGWVLEIRPELNDPLDPAKVLYTVRVNNGCPEAWYRDDLEPINDDSEPIEHEDSELLSKCLHNRVKDLYFAARQLDQWVHETEQSATSKNQMLATLIRDLDSAFVKFEGTAIANLYEIMETGANNSIRRAKAKGGAE